MKNPPSRIEFIFRSAFVLMFGPLFLVHAVRAESELFPFVISFDAPENATNISALLDAPAGKDGFVRVENGRFITDKGRIRFWGTNFCFSACFPEKDLADRVAARLARFGTNCVRLHHMDKQHLWGGSDAKTFLEIDPEQLDKLDYFIAALKKNGVYVNVNLHVSRQLDERDGFPKVVRRPSHDKGIDNYYRPFIEANKKFARDLLEHVNPYTGKAYKDEPCVAMIEINNENSIVKIWNSGTIDRIPSPFLDDFRKKWNDWLKAKYGNDDSLRKAWNCRTEPMGDEMLKNAGFLPQGGGWNVESGGGAEADVSNVDGIFRIAVRKKGKHAWNPQLSGSGFALEKGRIYTIEIKAKADRETTAKLNVRMNHDPWQGLGCSEEFDLSTDWRTLRFSFSAQAADADAGVTLTGLAEGTTYEIDSISLKPGGTFGLPKVERGFTDLIENGRFARDYVPPGWGVEKDPEGETNLRVEKKILRLDVGKKGKTAYRPRLCVSGFGLEKGKAYTLSMKAKASRPTGIKIDLRMNHGPWSILTDARTFELEENWRTLKHVFALKAGDENVRLCIGDLSENTAYEIEHVSLEPGDGSDVAAESSLAAGTVPLVWRKDAKRLPGAAVDDFCDFLLDLEAKYWNEMYRFLKEDIKVRQPVSGTQVNYGGTRAQAEMDYCDVHSYWAHPTFPGRPWDGGNWYVHNRALVNRLDQSILPPLATKRVYGKPYTLSEYNHPFPNRYGAEGFPLLAAFAAFQDWDGIFPFAYSHGTTLEPDRVTGMFDTCGNSVKTAHMIACNRFLCDAGDSERKPVLAPLTEEKEREILRRTHYAGFDFKGLGLDARIALEKPVALALNGEVEALPKTPEIPEDRKLFRTEPGSPVDILYDMRRPDRGFVSATGRSACLFTGFVETGKEYPFGKGTVAFGKTNLDWATVSLANVDGNDQRQRLLLVATGEMRNTDMKVRDLGEERLTAAGGWGKGPVLCEGIPVTLRFAKETKSVRCWSLDASGNRVRPIDANRSGNAFSLSLKPEYQTIWYELETTKY